MPSEVTEESKRSEFQKICLNGSGKGRVELLSTKHIFNYEAVLDRKQNKFDLALDFPVVGEKLLSLSLIPEVANLEVKNSEISELLKDHIGPREDRARIAKSVEEFFVFASDFLRYRANNIIPPHYSYEFKDGHFLMERNTKSYKFVVDNFSVNEKFYERTVFKIYIKDHSPDAIVTLFLVPQACE
jgi:hypothetical protein